jgi:hypothetical protein
LVIPILKLQMRHPPFAAPEPEAVHVGEMQFNPRRQCGSRIEAEN